MHIIEQSFLNKTILNQFDPPATFYIFATITSTYYITTHLEFQTQTIQINQFLSLSAIQYLIHIIHY